MIEVGGEEMRQALWGSESIHATAKLAGDTLGGGGKKKHSSRISKVTQAAQ